MRFFCCKISCLCVPYSIFFCRFFVVVLSFSLFKANFRLEIRKKSISSRVLPSSSMKNKGRIVKKQKPIKKQQNREEENKLGTVILQFGRINANTSVVLSCPTNQTEDPRVFLPLICANWGNRRKLRNAKNASTITISINWRNSDANNVIIIYAILVTESILSVIRGTRLKNIK